MKWFRRLFKRTPEYAPPKGFEQAYKSAVERVKRSQQTPETDPLIASCGKEVIDILVYTGSVDKATTKVYFNDGTVLIVDSFIGIRWDKPFIDTSVNLNRYTIEKKNNLYKRNEMVYKEVSL